MRLRVGGSDVRWKVKERKASSVYNKLNICAQETPQARSLYLIPLRPTLCSPFSQCPPFLCGQRPRPPCGSALRSR